MVFTSAKREKGSTNLFSTGRGRIVLLPQIVDRGEVDATATNDTVDRGNCIVLLLDTGDTLANGLTLMRPAGFYVQLAKNVSWKT